MRRVDLSSFNLNLLLALDGLLSQRSVTAAAKRVRVTPSAMSHSLSELRHLLGDPLLVRSGRGMVLTLALGAIVDEAPGIRRMDLLTEGFACAARKGHPRIDGALDLDSYVETPHLLITLGDDAGPTWIDQALAKLGRKRHVTARVRYFMAAPLIVARRISFSRARACSVAISPSSCRSRSCVLRSICPPIRRIAYWHQRFDEDPAHTWLRNLVKKTARSFGLEERPRKRSW
jgi:DNA-binding transcriptional LysR family regulator